MAAGLVLIREAGGFLSDMKGGTDLFSHAASWPGNELIHKHLLEVVNRPIPSN